MPVDVKEYLESMKSISSNATKSVKTVDQDQLKIQLLLSQLIEALSYANSMDFRQKTLNKKDVNDEKTGREILQTMKDQEKLISQLAEGQKLSDEQSKKLTEAIDKFYEMAGATEINYKKFAENLEKFVLKNDLPEAVKTRVINDSRDAHMIGQEQKNAEKNPVFKLLKKIKYALEDMGESTKQYRKKLFVTLDQFREGFLNAFDELGEKLKSTSIGDWISEIMKNLQMAGMAYLALQDMFAQGNFKWGQGLKEILNLQKLFKGGQLTETLGSMFKGIKYIFKQFGLLPKLISKFGLGKGLGMAAKGIGKGVLKGMGKGALKKIPLVGTLLSVWMGIERWKKKDYVGALIEFGSGIAAMFPGIGTLVSIGLDLINLGRDTGAFKAIGDKAEAKISNLNENVLLSIPIVGQIFGLKKTIDIWKTGDKVGALKMFTKTWASVIPGGAWVFDLMSTLFSTKFDKPNESSESNKNPEPTKGDKPPKKKKGWFGWGDAPVDGPFGDAPINWQNESGNYSPKGLTSNALQATKNLNSALGGGLTVTSAFRDPAKMMPLWNSATPIPGSRNRRNKYGNEMADPRRSNHARGLAIDIPKGLYNKVGPSRLTKLAKQSGFSLVYPEHSAVHLEVPKSGKVDKTDKKGVPTSVEPIAEIQPNVTDTGELEQSQPDAPMNFEDIMAKFSQFNEGVLNDPSVANVNKVYAQAEGQMKTPSMESLQPPAPAPQPPAPAPQVRQPVQQQVVQTVPTQAAPPAMDTGIDDTALALLNSVLFK